MPLPLTPNPRFSDTVFPSSSLFQMPKVFVVPPEEDDIPAWCFFDADETSPPDPLLEASPNLSIFKRSLGLLRDAPESPWPHNTSAFCEPTRSSLTADAPFNGEYLGFNKDIDATRELAREDGPAAGNDSEIVEVIKVGRRMADNEARCSSPAPSKTSTLKSYKTLWSLKLFGNRSSIIQPTTQSISTSDAVTGAEFKPAAKSPTYRTSTALMRFFYVLSAPLMRSSPASNTAEDTTEFPSSHSKPKRPPTLLSHLTRLRAHPDERRSHTPLPPPSMRASTMQAKSQYQAASPTGSSTFTASALNKGDTSFEEQLDSLHFEALSFDADKF